jgi:hypothetical protein
MSSGITESILEFTDFQTFEKFFHILIGETTALDSGGGSGRCDDNAAFKPSQRLEVEGACALPPAFELINFGEFSHDHGQFTIGEVQKAFGQIVSQKLYPIISEAALIVLTAV